VVDRQTRHLDVNQIIIINVQAIVNVAQMFALQIMALGLLACAIQVVKIEFLAVFLIVRKKKQNLKLLVVIFI
jgi:hypothetical protein